MPEFRFEAMPIEKRIAYRLTNKEWRAKQVGAAERALRDLVDARDSEIAAIDPGLSLSGQSDARLLIGNKYNARIDAARHELNGWRKGAIEAAIAQLPEVRARAARDVVPASEIEQRSALISQALTLAKARTTVETYGGGVTEAVPDIPALALELREMFAGDEAGMLALAQHEGISQDLATLASDAANVSASFQAKEAARAIRDGVVSVADRREAPVTELLDEIDEREREYVETVPNLFVIEHNPEGAAFAVQGLQVPA